MSLISGSGVIRDTDGNQTGTYTVDGNGNFVFTPTSGSATTEYLDPETGKYRQPQTGPITHLREFVCIQANIDGCFFWGWVVREGSPLPSQSTSGGTAKKS